MFNNCKSLISLDLSSFDTSKVSTMYGMFRDCSKLASLDISNFRTTKELLSMCGMFQRCTSLTELDLSGFYTNNVTDFSSLFENCSNLVTLDISNFHFGGVNQNPSASLFSGCNSLKNIAMIYCRVSSFNALQNSFNNLVATPVNVYYHDANLSELPIHGKVAYQYYGTSTVTLPYELNKLPNGVADYIDVVNGVYVQRVGKVVFDGSEKWSCPNNLQKDETVVAVLSGQAYGQIYNNGTNTSTGLCDKLNMEMSATTKTNIYNPDGTWVLSVLKKELSSSTLEGIKQWLSQKQPTVLGQLKTPIYTPLTDEEKALLPLSAYSNGHIQLSSDELRPSKFEFRAKSSNRMQLDMLETGHYYLNGSTGNVKLGNVDIDVTEMPCLINVSDASSKRLVVSGETYKFTIPMSDMARGYFFDDNGLYTPNEYMWCCHSYYKVDSGGYIYYEPNTYNRIAWYREDYSYISTVFNSSEGKFFVKIPNEAVYMRFGEVYSAVNTDLTFSINPITLSKLPSHRIPTTFTQGMKSSVDFGYWEGVKSAQPNAVLMFDSSMVEKQRVRINNGVGIELHSITGAYGYAGVTVEDEIDISTGKYTKRVGKYVIDGTVAPYQTLEHDEQYNIQKVVFLLSKIGIKPKFQWNNGSYGLVITDLLKFNVNYQLNEPHIFTATGSLTLFFKAGTFGAYTLENVQNYFKENPMTVYYELETPEITYLDLERNEFRTTSNRTNLQAHSLDNSNYLKPQVKPSPLSYPTTLSPNTQYTVFHNRKNYSGSVKTPMINLGGTEAVATGSRTVVTTPSTLAHNELQFIGGENTVEQVMVLHGDWTKEGKTVDYFEGLQSSTIGDKTLENLVGKPINIQSNRVTNSSNGGAVDYVSMDDVVAVYANKPKLPEVQVDTNVHSCGITLQNLAIETIYNQADVYYYNVKSFCNYKAGVTYTIIMDVDFEYSEDVDASATMGLYGGFIGQNNDWNIACYTDEIGTRTTKFKDKLCFKITTATTNPPKNEFMVRINQQEKIVKFDVTNFIILEGDYTDIDIPFFEGMKSVENPILTTVGKNLYNSKNSYVSGAFNQNISNEMNVEPNTTYTFYANGKSWVTVDLFNKENVNTRRLGGTKDSTESITFTTTNEEVSVMLTYYLGDNTIIENVDFTGVQLEQGTQATAYEPYKSSILSTPQGTVLRGVGSYKDVIGWNDGIIRRNCVEFTITGEEGYTISGITENTNTIMCGIDWKNLGLENKIPTNDRVNMVICDKLPSMAGNEDTPHIRQNNGTPYSYNLMFWFDKTKFSTYTSQGINDYIKSIGRLTIVAPLADTQYENVEFTGGGNWKEFVLTGSSTWWDAAGEGDTTNGFSVWTTIGDFVDANNDNPLKYRIVKESELEYIDYYKTPNSTNFISFNPKQQIVVNVKGCHSVEQVKTWLDEHPITILFQSIGNTLQNTTFNTDLLIFNHGTLYTTTDTHPSTFLDFTLKTTNRYAVKDFNTLKYTVLTKQPFNFNGVDYPTSSTGITIVDVTNAVDSNMYSDDPMITVVQEDGNYYADGVLQQFKGEQTFTKEFIRTSNGTYNTGMTLLEPLELGGLPNGVKDEYNPTTGEIIKRTHTIQFDYPMGDKVIMEGWNVWYETKGSPNGVLNFFKHYDQFSEIKQANLNALGKGVGSHGESAFLHNSYQSTKESMGCGAVYFTIGVRQEHLGVTWDNTQQEMIDAFHNWLSINKPTMTYELQTYETIQATPTSTYISTRPENGNIVAQDTQIQAEYLNYDNEQSIISPRMLGDGDTIRWEQGSQCYVYENDNEYIPLTEHDELFGANVQAQEYTQYVESVEGAKVELGIALKEKAVYEQTYVKYEDNIVYPTTMENIDETNGVEVDYICGATWQNPDDLSDIRHLGTLREDGQYDVTIRRSGDDEIRLVEGTTHIGLDYDELPPSEFELTFFNNGGVEVGKYGDTIHTLEDCVEDSKLASGTVYGQTLVNLIDFKGNSLQSAGSVTSRGINTITFKTNSTGKFNIGCTVDLKPSTKYCIKANIQSTNRVAFRVLDVKDNQYKISEDIPTNGEYIGTFTASSYATTGQVTFYRGTTVGEETITGTVTLIEYIDGCENWLEHFEGINSTVVNGFSSCGKNLIYGSTGTMEDNGLTWTWNNGIITLNGQKTGDDSYLYLREDRLNIHPMIDGYYSISYKVLSGEVDTTECRLGNTYSQLTLSDYTNTHVLSLYGSESSYYSDNKFFYGILPDKLAGCWMRVHKGAKFNNLKIQFQLERSSVHTAFEEPKIINYTLPAPIALRKVGDVCDTFDDYW
jgi:surface protein